MKIKLKLIILLIVTSLFLTTGLSLIIYQNQKRVLKRHIYSHLESISEAKLLRIQSMLKEMYEITRFPANDSAIISSLSKYKQHQYFNIQGNIAPQLKKYTLIIPSFQRVHILSIHGEIIASSDNGYVGSDWHEHNTFLIAAKGRTYVDEFHYTGNNLNVFLSAPIYSTGDLIGVIIIDSKANDILTLTNDYTGLGKTGETVLAKKKKDTICYLTPVRHVNTASLKKIISSKDSLVEMSILLKSKNKLIKETNDYRGVKVLASGRYISDVGWGMVTTIDYAEAMMPIYNLKKMMIIYNIGVVMVALIIAYIAGTYISKPIESLKKSADKISRGDLGHRTIAYNSSLEIKALSKSFNIMAEKLSAKIHETESFSSKVLEAALHGIMVFQAIWDSNGRIIDFKYILVNSAAEKILGRKKEDLIGKRWLMEFPEFRTMGLFDIKKRVVETGESESIEFFDDSENVNRWFRNRYVKFKDGVIVTRDDITGLKEINITLERIQKFLLDSQEIAQVGSFEWDITNDIISGTLEYQRLFSYEKNTNSIEDFFERIHIDYREHVRVRLYNALFNNTPFDIEYAITGPDGSIQFVLSRAQVYFDQEGKAIRMMGAVFNISKLKQTEIELKNAKESLQIVNNNLEERVKNRTQELSVLIEQLKSTNERLDKSAYVISHDLKSPVNSIEGLINIIQEEYQNKNLDQKADEILGMIHTTVYNMRHLIDDVLKSAKNEKSIKESIDLYSLTHEIIRTFNPLPKFHIFIQEPLPIVKYNRTALIQILQNLISNAIKYMDKDYPLIKIGSVEEPEFYKICISDNGPGIAKDKHDKIFEIFEIAHNDITKDSHGLGLSIVKQLVEQHQGKIWVESEIGNETTFYFSIPK